MANEKISAMPNASALAGTEKLAGVQSGANVNVTPAQVSTYVRIAANGTDSGASSRGGQIVITAGDGAASSARASYGGNATFQAGNGGDTTGFGSYGGNVYVRAGRGHASGNVYGNGGVAKIFGGNGYSDGYNAVAGNVGLYGGNASGAYGGSGGAVRLKGGTAAAGTSAPNFGGNVEITGGYITGHSSSDYAGTISLRSGQASTHGHGGDIRLILSTGVDGNGHLIFSGLPTADPMINGAVWNSSGTLKIH